MNHKTIRTIFSLLLLCGICPSYALAANAGSISVTVTFEEASAKIIVIPPNNQTGRPNQTITYKFTVKNNGKSPDSYVMSAASSNNWNTGFPKGNTTKPLKPGQQKKITVSLAIPQNTAATNDILTVTATSSATPSVFASGEVTTIVCYNPGDFNGDKIVDAADAIIFQKSIGSSTGDANFNKCADFDNDERITMNDYRRFRRLYGSSY